MKKVIFLLCIIIFSQKIIVAQQVSLKHPLSEADYISFDKVARNCFVTIDLNFNFEINLEDFHDPKYIKPDRPDSLRHIEELEKKIKGNYRDAKIYLDIGTIYKRLYMLEDAHKNFSRALDLAKEYVKNNPDSASAYSILGASFFSLDDFTEAGLAFEQSYNLNKNDSIALTVIPICYTFSGNFNSALTTINNIIDKNPNKIDNYTYLVTTLYMQKFTE
ncbi:MAG: tetratricopeptide repeat protein, partial [Bacteroidia bacterium]|nr:tetratricopeptide repeat protein [Bacteroidia bacterium]